MITLSCVLVLNMYASLFVLHAAAVSLPSVGGEGVIWLSGVRCSGLEAGLMDCVTDMPLGVHECDHAQDASVRCVGNNCTEGAIRFRAGGGVGGGASQFVGRVVEICHRNVWGAVCADSWDTLDARVACRQLGLPSEGKDYYFSLYSI